MVNLHKELEKAEKDGTDKQDIYEKYAEVSKKNRQEAVAEGCSGNPFCANGALSEAAAGSDIANSLKRLPLFSDLSSDDLSQLDRFVLAENEDSARAIYQAMPDYMKVALTGKVDVASNAMAHAVLGAVTAQLNNQSAVAGGLGAGGGELAARYIAGQLFPGRAADQLSESEKQQVSALSELATGVAAGQAGKNAVENNYLSEKESRQLDKELSACKSTGGDCKSVVEKYIEISNKNSKELAEACTGGGVVCVSWEEMVQAETNVALDADKHQIRLSEKLKDPDAAALVKYLNGTDLKFLKDNITTGDRVMDVVMTPTSWPVAIMGGKAIITNSAGVKEQLIAAGVSSAANTAIQYGTSKTGEVKLSDVIGSGVIGLITAGKGYNPTVTWNAAGGYYTAEIKGDDPFMGALLSKAGASVGYAVGNVIKVPMDKILNPISKQYEWVPAGIWTITKPATMNPVPNLVGNIVGSGTSETTVNGLSDLNKVGKK